MVRGRVVLSGSSTSSSPDHGPLDPHNEDGQVPHRRPDRPERVRREYDETETEIPGEDRQELHRDRFSCR
jgi:hypothetical protein